MEEIWQLLKSPSWWFTVVLVALLVAFAKDILVSAAVRFRRWLSLTREQRKKERAEEVEFLVSNPDILTREISNCLIGYCLIVSD